MCQASPKGCKPISSLHPPNTPVMEVPVFIPISQTKSKMHREL